MGRFFRRLFRYAFPAAAGCSALALAACLILWPLSYRRAMDLGYATSGGSACSLGVRGGRLWVQHTIHSLGRPGFTYAFDPLDPGYAGWSYTDWKHEELSLFLSSRDRALGGEWFRGDGVSFLAIPLLYLTLSSALLPAFGLWGLRRRRQARLARRGFPVEPVA